MASGYMKMSALGRPFTLGMLYDARRDELIPGKLWDDKTLQTHIEDRKEFHPSSTYEITSSDSIESKASLLGVEASLTASVLSGLIDVKGFAKYLNDRKKFKNQRRVTCQYSARTRFTQLSMCDLSNLTTEQKDVIEKGFATHVVIGIRYGANAVFVFDSEKSEASSGQEAQVNLEAMIKKIRSFGSGAKLKMTDEEKALTETFSCKFYGDFILRSNPSTFEEVVQTNVQLPQLLGERGENGVPMKVWLMPLKMLCSGAAEVISELSDEIVKKMEHALEDVREMEMRCNDFLEDKVVKDFPQILEKELIAFQRYCNDYESNLKKTMAEKLPSIREGKEDERSLEQLFEERDKSPFSHEKLSKWLDNKEREINIIRACVDIMKGTKIVSNQSELDKEILAPGVKNALCFVFTSIERGDNYLDEMATFVKSRKFASTNEDQWYYSEEFVRDMRKKAKAFHNLTEAQKNNNRVRFLIAAIANGKYPGATIYHYKENILVTEDFLKPGLLKPEDITDKQDFLLYACDLTLDPNTANSYLTLSEGNKMATCGAWQSYPDHPERFDTQTQVLCTESLSDRHYWEVKWSSNVWIRKSIFAAVTYKGIDRKGGNETGLGKTPTSWAFGKSGRLRNGHWLSAWHNGKRKQESFHSCFENVGVYLDWPAGTLSFYNVSSNTLEHLYTFRDRFTEPVYPALWVHCKGNYAYLCPVEYEL